MKIYGILCAKKRQMFLAVIVSSVFMMSCQKDAIQLNDSDTALTAESSDQAVAQDANLLFIERFEGSAPFSTYVQKQIGTTYGFTKVSSPVFEGSGAGRFELRDTDPITSGGTRTEVKFPDLTHPDRWYSFNIYFPSAEYGYDSQAEIINQWHQGGGASPSISLITRYDKLILETRSEPEEKERTELGTLVKNKWRTYVLHIIHSHGSDGLIEMWEDGKKIVERKGANAYDFGSYDKPKWKLGLYKWEWNGDATTDVSKRVVFFDNVRLGNEKATYANMVSSGSPTPDPSVPTTPTPTPTEPKPDTPKPTPPVPSNPTVPVPPTNPTPTTPTSGAIKNFTLVDAHTEKDVLVITEGSTISLAKFNLFKANIRANLVSADKSIRFELTGPQAYSSKDSHFPYALFGDDTKGNYYYGIWKNPVPGRYTLKATPFSGLKASGTAGKTVTLTFTIAS